MSVDSLTNVLQPSGILGPPVVMSGFQTLAGDVSSGGSTIAFLLEAGFLWMPLLCSFGNSGTTTLDANIQLRDIEDTVGVGADIWSQLVPITVATNGSARSSFVMPRMLIQTQSDAAWRFFTQNVNGVTAQFYVRALRWPKNSAPEAWLAYFTAPP